jgi:oligogalacturonide lyase
MTILTRLPWLLLALAPSLRAGELRSDWIDPDTGHRIIRLSPDSGGGSLYFHQHSYTPEGDKVVIRGAGGIATVDLSTLGVSPPKFDLILPGASPISVAWHSREAYYLNPSRTALMAVNLDTKAIREVVALPPAAQGRGGQFALNCDETLLVGIGPDPDGKVVPRTPPPDGGGGTLEANWAAGTPKMIYTVNIKTGEFRVIHRENDWTNHLQCSPTDPQQILFCHEGPWHFNDRTWTVRADDGKPARLLHERTMNMEIEGHEFFSADGQTVWYDLQTPRSTVFWLGGVNLKTGHRTWYNLQRDEWSVHYNVSRDGLLFAGDGGGPTGVAMRTGDGRLIEPPPHDQWINLFRPAMVRGNSFRDKKDLIDVGVFQTERLVNMARHSYSKQTGVEPNLTFTPDGKWIIFSGNFDSNPGDGKKATTHVYAVEIARHDRPSAK